MITQKKLKELFSYNKATGKLRRKSSGLAVGTRDKDGYLNINVDRKQYKIHRLAWLYVYGELTYNEIHHKNHKRDDNRIKNLEAVTHQENLVKRRLFKNNISGYAGVTFNRHSHRWVVTLSRDNKNYNFGSYKELEIAVKIIKRARREYLGNGKFLSKIKKKHLWIKK